MKRLLRAVWHRIAWRKDDTPADYWENQPNVGPPQR